MKYWPVNNLPKKVLPKHGEQGSFWEDRGDRHHAGIDLYAPVGAEVIAIESGTVIEVVTFTSPQMINYWNITFSVLVQANDGIIFRYAEMDDAAVKVGDFIQAGQLVGHVGMVLNPEKIDNTSPIYIQSLKNAGLPSMLHFEMHHSLPEKESYLGGNYFLPLQPRQLMDPTPYLQEILDNAG